MAEAALIGIAKSILRQVASPAFKEFKLLWGHKAQIEKLQDTISSIKNVLHDADRKQASDAAVRGWLARLRIVLYEADDLFDVISHRVLREKAKAGSKMRKEVRRLLSKPYHFAFIVKTIQKVKAIRKSLDNIARDINQLNFIPSQTDPDLPRRTWREQTHSYTKSNEVVGREQEREFLVKMLLPEGSEERRGVSVVVVFGIGGFGKTTLAQLVFNDEIVQKGFDLCMWACINYLSDLKEVLITIIRSAKNFEPEGYDLDQLQRLLREMIDGKRFLLVIDDVWDEDAQNWHKLKILLDSGEVGSMVLATARSVNVAQSMGAAKPYCHLQGLSDQSAWLLFKKLAFGEEEEDQKSQDLELLGLQIVKKCANAPLAIVTIASLLRHKEKKKWFLLVNDELSTAVPDEYQKIMQALKISYNALPFPVKRCFAYCSLFPKDHVLTNDLLIPLWIAQGFVEPGSVSQSLEDVAEDYFFCLLDRCFLQCNYSNVCSGLERYYCRMHDLVHGLAVDVAGLESVLVDQVVPNFGEKTLRHVSLYCESDSLVNQLFSFSQSKHLRTLLFHNKISFKASTLDKLMSGFTSLRVLDLSYVRITELPASLGKFIHLRYLDLTGNNMEILPGSICCLHHLQTLILFGCHRLKELPKDLGKLISLRHLQIRFCDKLSVMVPGLAALTSLVSLDQLIVHNPSGGLRYLECLDSLSGSLRIELPTSGWQNAVTDAERSCLSKKHRLNGLVIESESPIFPADFPELETVMNALQPHANLEYLEILRFGLTQMPPWIYSLHNLVSLTIASCARCTELSTLSHLESLKELNISHMNSLVNVEDGMSYDPGSFFKSLAILCIRNMPNLTGWWTQASTLLPALPRVTKLTIRECWKLTACMPLFPQVEDMELSGIQEKVFWLAIGCDPVSDTSNRISMLKRLELSEINGLSGLPEVRIRHLAILQRLQISGCGRFALSRTGLAQLTSLEELRIIKYGKFEWVDGDGHGPEMPWKYLPRLRFSEVPLVDRIIFKGFKHLTYPEELTTLHFNQNLPRDDVIVWKSLQSLRFVELGFGRTISRRSSYRFPEGIQYLSSLQELTISHCNELYLSWRLLVSLPRLLILKIEEVENVIDGGSAAAEGPVCSLQQLIVLSTTYRWLGDIPWKSFPSLQCLRLENISYLEALPDGVQHLTNLRELKMFMCQRLMSLPSWMSNLCSLHTLHLLRCSEELKERCERLTGEDWLKIQHIQLIQTS